MRRLTRLQMRILVLDNWKGTCTLVLGYEDGERGYKLPVVMDLWLPGAQHKVMQRPSECGTGHCRRQYEHHDQQFREDIR